MSLTYSSWASQLATVTAISSSDAQFPTLMSGSIDYAEGRLYRELDLLSVRITDTSVACTSGVRTISQSTAQGYFLVIEELNIFSSAGATSSFAQRNPVTFVSPDFLNAVYPSAVSSCCGLPEFAARINDTQITFGPAPDAAYNTEIIGTIRPTPLSSGNSSTWLTQNVPECFFAATMVYAAGHMRDYGRQSDDPQFAQSWETQYNNLVKTALSDTLRMKFQSQAWSNQQPNAIATPPRT